MATGENQFQISKIKDLQKDLNIRYDWELGNGLTSQVLLGKDPQNNNPRAFKVIRKLSKKGVSNRTSFYRELSILQQVRHPFIIDDVKSENETAWLEEVRKTYEKGYSTALHFALSMPYYPCGDLYSRIPDVTPELADKIFVQLVSAVRHLHRNQLAHRDVKPENVLLTWDDNVKLCDFGMACRVGDDVTCSDKCGTPGYMAPEILAQKPYDVYKADVYALGMTMWVMLCPSESIPDNKHLHSLLPGQDLDVYHKALLYLMLDPRVKSRPDIFRLTNFVFGLQRFKDYFHLLS